MGRFMLQGSSGKGDALDSLDLTRHDAHRGNEMAKSRMLLRVVQATTMLAIAGCAFPARLQRIAVDQNQVIATTADSLTLLNIIRAKTYRPVHFTSISRISGNVVLNAGGSVGGGITVSGGDTVSLSPGASVGMATNPNFDMTIHDSQGFQRGIMQPIAPDIINYYLHTGWRSDLLTYLLVERIDFITEKAVTIGDRTYKPGESIETLQNDPSDPDQAKLFHDFVACFSLSASQRPGDTLPIARLADMAPVGLGDLAILDGKTFDLGGGPGAREAGQDVAPAEKRDWVVRKTAGGEAVGLSRATGRQCQAATLTLIDGNSVTGQSEPTVADLYPTRTRSFVVDIAGRRVSVPTSVDITFRSVDGVIYFLGEYLRAADDKTREAYAIPRKDGTTTKPEPLLLVAPGRGGPHDLSVSLEGNSWHVPADCKCRSYQVIALINQLFNLHKSGTAAPLSTAVRVVN
jgi:hypothetical protein